MVPAGPITGDRVTKQVLGGIGTALRHGPVIDIHDTRVCERRCGLVTCGTQLLADEMVDPGPHQPCGLRWHVPHQPHHPVRLRNQCQRSALPPDRIPRFGALFVQSVPHPSGKTLHLPHS